MSASAETKIKETEIPQRGLIIVIARSSKNPQPLRPYTLTIKDEARGTASIVGTFTCVASAEHALEVILKRLSADGSHVGKEAPAPAENEPRRVPLRGK
jgi:glycine cleavage system regulatory protein